jgi:hypothetical protein
MIQGRCLIEKIANIINPKDAMAHIILPVMFGEKVNVFIFINP